MIIQYVGHSCFVFTSKDGHKIVTDPFHSSIGYNMPKIQADVVTVSHYHFDHNNTGKILGNYEYFNAPGDFTAGNIKINGVASFHDNVQGRERGENIIFCFQVDGMHICHAGDLGHVPNRDQLEKIGRTDILFLPVGEVFTLKMKDVRRTIELIKPIVTIPMHYRTKDLVIGIEPIDQFIKQVGSCRQLNNDRLTVSRENIDDYKGALIMDFEGLKSEKQ